jgi:hypothetical protein
MASPPLDDEDWNAEPPPPPAPAPVPVSEPPPWMRSARDKKHDPSLVTMQFVSDAAGFGLDNDQIAKLMGITPRVLEKCYEEILASSRTDKIMKLAANMYRLASSSYDEKIQMAACQWLLERWGGQEFRKPPERIETKQIVDDKKPVVDMSKLTYEERQEWRTLLKKLEGTQMRTPDEAVELALGQDSRGLAS